MRLVAVTAAALVGPVIVQSRSDVKEHLVRHYSCLHLSAFDDDGDGRAVHCYRISLVGRGESAAPGAKTAAAVEGQQKKKSSTSDTVT